MASLKFIKRLASSVLGLGTSHIKILDAIKAGDALTRDDVRGLISEGVIVGEPVAGVGKSKARLKQRKVRKGRRRGQGSKKGATGPVARRVWITTTRSLRALLKRLKPSLNDASSYRAVYKKIKGGLFKNKRQLLLYLKENKLVK